MEVVVAVIRSKPNIGNQDFRGRLYDILLLDSKTPPGEKVKQAKYLPMFSMNVTEDEPRELVLDHVFKITGSGDHGVGLKGERAIQIPLHTGNRTDSRMNLRESLSRFSLFFVAINSHDKLNKRFVEQAQNTPGFYSLDSVMEMLNNSSINFPSPTKSLLAHLESWLQENHSRPGTVDCLFRPKTDYRIRLTVHNPVFIPSHLSHNETVGNIGDLPTDFQMTANEALAKMLSIEKCDIVVMNPLFGSGLPYKTKANCVVINKFWEQGIPVPNNNVRRDSAPEELRWRDKYPVHWRAAKGDARGVRDLVRHHGQHHSKKDSMSLAPIHYGAWYGKADVVSTLLELGCSPNITDGDDSTPLHIAAKKGYPQVARYLLLHHSTNISSKDCEGRTALDLCVHAPDRNRQHELVINYIREAQIRPSMTIQIYLMDKSVKLLNLPSGYDTTVHQLCELMMEEFNLPSETYSDIFTIWTCSPSLQLQLKPDHKPTTQLQTWSRTLHMLTDASSDEEPVLKWRRNAKISVERERHLSHPEAVNLLFSEAYDNYINAMYPCKDHDVLTFAAILFCLDYGDLESSTARSILSNEENMKQLVPAVFLKAKGSPHNKILREYNNRDQTIGTDRSTLSLQRKFLNSCYMLTVYGSAFFEGNLMGKSRTIIHCHIGVNDVGLHIINAQNKLMLHSYSYSEMKQWREQDFVLEIHIFKPESKSKRQQTSALKIRTKQAGLIVILMNKLNTQMQYMTRGR